MHPSNAAASVEPARRARVLLFTILMTALAAIGLAAPRGAAAQAPCAEDRTETDFGQAASMSGVVLSLTDDGEVILTPTLVTEFSGTSLSADWADFPWGGGGGSIVAGGVVTVDGSRVNSEPPPGFPAGHSLEFVATFAAVPFQHVGFGAGNDLPSGEIFNTSPWAIFSTRSSGTQLFASTWDALLVDVPLPAVTLGVPHRFRIDWQASTIDYYVDGTLVHSEPTAIGGTMRPAISDFTVGGPTLVVDWMRLSPYASPGVFQSRIFDAGGPIVWATMTWTDEIPAAASLAMEVRTGNTAVPDGSWTAYVAVPASGTNLGLSSRYIQYRATLATTDPAVTPALLDVQIECQEPTPTRARSWGGVKGRYR